MKLRMLKSPIRNVELSAVAREAPPVSGKPFANSRTAQMRITGRALQKRNARIALRDRYTCQACGRVVDKHEGQVDHRIPLSQGGTEDDANLQWLCIEPCHREKSQRESRGLTV